MLSGPKTPFWTRQPGVSLSCPLMMFWDPCFLVLFAVFSCISIFLTSRIPVLIWQRSRWLDIKLVGNERKPPTQYFLQYGLQLQYIFFYPKCANVLVAVMCGCSWFIFFYRHFCQPLLCPIFEPPLLLLLIFCCCYNILLFYYFTIIVK